jgi:CDGSH-type Zn-finger protein
MSMSGGDGPRRIFVTRDGPVLVEGPVEIVLEAGGAVVSERAVVALCTCKRSRSYPLCDTSHRKRSRAAPTTAYAAPAESS